MPQLLIYAGAQSSDYVSGWGDYRFNNFYDQVWVKVSIFSEVFRPNRNPVALSKLRDNVAENSAGFFRKTASFLQKKSW